MDLRDTQAECSRQIRSLICQEELCPLLGFWVEFKNELQKLGPGTTPFLVPLYPILFSASPLLCTSVFPYVYLTLCVSTSVHLSPFVSISLQVSVLHTCMHPGWTDMGSDSTKQCSGLHSTASHKYPQSLLHNSVTQTHREGTEAP